MKWRDLAVIKGTRDGFLIRLDDESEFSSVLDQLRRKLESANGFFRNTNAVVDVGRRSLTEAETEELTRLLRETHAVELRDIVASDPDTDPHAGDEDALSAPEEGGAPGPGVSRAEARAGGRSARRRIESEGPSLLLYRTLRSGQSVHYDGNVIIIGDVNPGAEVIATGDIVVMGVFRGVAHAGARGDEQAVVVALGLAATQLRIAGYIGRAPDHQGSVRPQPEMALVREGMVVLEPYPGRALSNTTL